MKIRQVAPTVAVLLLAVVGCGGNTGLTAEQVVDAFNQLHPVGTSRDTTAACEPAGCIALVTTDRVSVSQWPDESEAGKWRSGAYGDGEAERIGVFVVAFGQGEQASTPPDVRTAYLAKLRELVAAGT